MELIGLIGSVCFALCGIPAAHEAWKKKACQYPWGFLLLWAIGEVFTLAYIFHLKEWILTLNYGSNLICLIILIYYNHKPWLKSDQP